MEDLCLLYSTNVWNSLVLFIYFVDFIFVEHLFLVNLNVNIDLCICFLAEIWLHQRLEDIGVLAECLFILSEVYFDIWHVADLMSCNHSKDMFLIQWLEFPTLELEEIWIILRDILAVKLLPEQRHQSLNVARHVGLCSLTLSAVEECLLQDGRYAHSSRLDVAQIRSLCISSTSFFPEQLLRS